MRRVGAQVAWLIPVLLVVGLLAYAATARRPGASVTAALARGEQPSAPDFALPRLNPLLQPGGSLPLRLSDLRGRPVVVNFWASWCVPCREEAPLLERLAREYGASGIQVVGVNIQDLEPEARRFLREYKITYPNVRDRDGWVPRKYGVTGVPETFLVNPSGKIVRKFPGAVVDYQVWRDALDALLATPAR